MRAIVERMERHKKFWNREKTDRPLIGFRINQNCFPVQWFTSAKNLMQNNLEIKPDMLDVKEFAAECTDMYEMHEKTGQDLFWTAEPFTAVPWIEAISGCRIFGSLSSLWAEHWLEDLSEINKINFENDNLWLKKYNEFLVALDEVSQGRFPIGQPIIRGPLDLASTLRGASNFIMDFYDNTEAISSLIHKAADIFIELVKNHINMVKPFYQGYSMGMYHLWAPGKCIWFQEDASALLSPDIYSRFAKDQDARICDTYPYTLVHLHPSSFFLIDDLLSIDSLKVIQVNKDTGGPSICEMLPVLKKILDKKCLFLWGELTEEDMEIILEELSYSGLGMQIYAASLEKACSLMETAKKKAL